MKTASAKAKGRNLQKHVCEMLLKLGERFGLVEGDVSSRSMGANGVDVILSPAAKKVLGNLAIECKNVEKLNVLQAYRQHASKYTLSLPLLIHKKNGSEPLCTLSFKDFLWLHDAVVAFKNRGNDVTSQIQPS